MEQYEIMDRLRTIITPYARDQQALLDFGPDTDFIRDLKMNSANLVDVVLDVEEAFGIAIDNEAMEHMLTVGSAIDIVQEKMAGA